MSETHPFRICVLVDVEAPTLAEAYGAVYTAMSATAKVMARVGVVGWESADNDWFEEGGAEVDKEEVIEARTDFLENRTLRAELRARIKERG